MKTVKSMTLVLVLGGLLLTGPVLPVAAEVVDTVPAQPGHEYDLKMHQSL